MLNQQTFRRFLSSFPDTLGSNPFGHHDQSYWQSGTCLTPKRYGTLAQSVIRVVPPQFLFSLNTTSEAGTGTSQYNATLDDFAVCEEQQWMVSIITIEGMQTLNISVEFASSLFGAKLEVISGQVVYIGSVLSNTSLVVGSPAKVLDSALVDGIADTAMFDFGSIALVAMRSETSSWATMSRSLTSAAPARARPTPWWAARARTEACCPEC